MAELASFWYAVRVRTSHEARVFRRFGEKRINAYYPTWIERKRWSDRPKAVERPLFAGYLFVRLAPETCAHAVLQTPGVIEILGAAARPEPIPDQQMDAVRRAVEAGNAEPAPYRPGELVDIQHGPFRGVRARVERVKGGRILVIPIASIGAAVSVRVEAGDLRRT